MQGILLKAISSFYYVSCNGVTYECKARGNFRKSGISPVVGDRVEISLTDTLHGVVEKVCERKNLLNRPLVANIDKLVIVSSYTTPAPDLMMIDRLCATAVYHNILPVIVFNKCDCGDFSYYSGIYSHVGFSTYTVSAKTGEGIDDLGEELRGCVCAFAGNSGVGKSSILNALFGELNLATGDVSEKLGRGRHTTRHTELFVNNLGGFVADTPGFSSIEADDNYDFKEKLADCFPDFSDYISSCRFSSCTHTCEKGCAVLDAVSSGEIEQTRLESYRALFNEYKDLKPWTKK
ncbi:MAG: ribosome small subunit-dependent GTPase A [Ruminococcaceae bacterium]|nr:ribosome small subunit-dependent GTPase A [Oscillospiraceae bacterium]